MRHLLLNETAQFCKILQVLVFKVAVQLHGTDSTLHEIKLDVVSSNLIKSRVMEGQGPISQEEHRKFSY